jgi:geranylgeranyl diphosphate synthase, type I
MEGTKLIICCDILAGMSSSGIEIVPDPLAPVRDRVEAAVLDCLDDAALEVSRDDPDSRILVDEVARLVRAGGKRVRPAFCYWGYRAAGGEDGDPIVRAAAAMELLHSMALIHDDLIDDATERRGVTASAPHLAAHATARSWPVDPGRFGTAAALLAGDLAAVLADRLLSTSGFAPESLQRAAEPYDRMRIAMAAGQLLDVAGLARDPARVRRAARLRGGAYTVEGPAQVGAALAGGSEEVRRALARYGRPLGEAFQLRDDLLDAEAGPGVTSSIVNGLVDQARRALEAPSIDAAASGALDELARLVEMR